MNRRAVTSTALPSFLLSSSNAVDFPAPGSPKSTYACADRKSDSFSPSDTHLSPCHRETDRSTSTASLFQPAFGGPGKGLVELHATRPPLGSDLGVPVGLDRGCRRRRTDERRGQCSTSGPSASESSEHACPLLAHADHVLVDPGPFGAGFDYGEEAGLRAVDGARYGVRYPKLGDLPFLRSFVSLCRGQRLGVGGDTTK